MPKRMRSTFSSRGVSVASTLRVCSARSIEMTASAGEITLLSSMKSPRCESSSSPTGVSSEIGSLRDLQDLADLVRRKLHLLRDLVGRRLASQLLHQERAWCG